jgi:hypothetical protein
MGEGGGGQITYSRNIPLVLYKQYIKYGKLLNNKRIGLFVNDAKPHAHSLIKKGEFLKMFTYIVI